MFTLSPEPISVEKYSLGQWALPEKKILVNNILTKFGQKHFIRIRLRHF